MGVGLDSVRIAARMPRIRTRMMALPSTPRMGSQGEEVGRSVILSIYRTLMLGSKEKESEILAIFLTYRTLQLGSEEKEERRRLAILWL